jgi:acetoin utilization protein AcuC
LKGYDVEMLDPGLATVEDLLLVHSQEYIDAVKAFSEEKEPEGFWGFGSLDNPAFPGIYEASLAYTGGSAAAARAVSEGAPLAFNIAGGLHHARRDQASGFCTFNDCAVACAILRQSFQRVAYIDIDVHHGDGVQWIFYEDPSVLTCSIHQDGRTIYPGTGGVEETGKNFSAVNVPMWPRTTGDVWLNAFQRAILPAVKRFAPEAIVLQMGTDAHFNDRLGGLCVTTQEWLQAVRLVKDLGIPIVALGGGGYTLSNVPRMWTMACLTLGDVPFADTLPGELAPEMEALTYSDQSLPLPRQQGAREAEEALQELFLRSGTVV